MKREKILSGKEGMIWGSFDMKIPIVNRIREAVDYFEKKYGVFPDLIFVNPETLGNGEVDLNGIKIVPDSTVLKNNFYIYCKKDQ
jgi:hypothetical protein